MATRYTRKDGNIALPGTWDGAVDEQQTYNSWSGSGQSLKFVYGGNECECDGDTGAIITALETMIPTWSGLIDADTVEEGILGITWDSSLGALNQLAGYYWDDGQGTWESLPWARASEGVVGTLPTSSDTGQIRYNNTMTSGSLTLAALYIFGEEGDPEGDPPTDDRMAYLSINGGTLTVTGAFSPNGSYSSGLAVSAGTFTGGWSGTLTGDGFGASNGDPRSALIVVSGTGAINLTGNIKGGAGGSYSPEEGDPSHGEGGDVIAYDGGTLSLTGNIQGGVGESGSYWLGEEEVTYDAAGGNGIAGNGNGSVTIIGSLTLDTTGTGASGVPVVTPSVTTFRLTGNATGSDTVSAFEINQNNPSGGQVVKGIVTKKNIGYLRLTGSETVPEGSTWFYDLSNDLAITFANLTLTNNGNFGFYARGGTVTSVTNAAINNSAGAGYLGIGATIPTVTWEEGGIAPEDVVSADYVVVGHDNYVGGSAGTYPTSATSKAEQYATDQASVLASAGYILVGHSILEQSGSYAPDFPAAANVAPDDTTNGIQGTMDLPALNKVAPSDTLRGVAGTMDLPTLASVSTLDTLEGVAGTLDIAAIEEAAAAAQLAVDVAEIGEQAADIIVGATILTVEGTFVVPTEAQVALGVQYGGGGVEFTGELVTQRLPVQPVQGSSKVKIIT